MNIEIRQEEERDYKLTAYIVEKAFEDAPYSDHKEHQLVERLRKSNAFIPELSLVAEVDEKPAGHIMFTRLQIRNGTESYESLALAPVSVLPEYQNQGIGSMLILEGLELAAKMGFKSVIVLGHHQYYPRFGFRPASAWGIQPPFEVPDESFMALELEEGSLTGVSGQVIYPEEFFD